MPERLPLSVNCPKCNSNDIVYTCEPNCCFNHLCEKCYTTFELSTNLKGKHNDLTEPSPEKGDICAPTVACARCESLDVFHLADSGEAKSKSLVCTSCHALLELVVSLN